ncbi:MAG: YceI family protein [Planctomycetota bacterium]|nr:YceI family protein [Planctomycetota bacterium]MEC9157047.1 YceI family protein [Planctomycetota bacterium]MED5507548.1 YceI family protein [Planctomycetota bacterium]MED6307091.1 YceI family protein [Planctomycetota bacterium]
MNHLPNPIRLTTLALTTGLLMAGGLVAASAVDGPSVQEQEAASSSPDAWSVDTVHSCAMFRVRHMGAGYFWGRFNDIAGTIDFDPDRPESLAMDISIDVESVDSGHPGLDKHLKSPDFFDVKEFPLMTFKSERVKQKPTDRRADSPAMAWDVTGQITMCGKSMELTAEVVYWGAANLGRGDRAGFETTFSIKRSEFGINYGVDQGSLGDMVNVTAAFEVTK